eukprot:NODE_87_length_21935_cov_0.397142.p9 type:complete len:166 gc:universal NODE_87_length_21935_cov_0.397142:6455-5958(-)
MSIAVRDGYLLQCYNNRLKKTNSTSEADKYNSSKYELLPISWGSLNDRHPYFTRSPKYTIFKWNIGLNYRYPNNVIPFASRNVVEGEKVEDNSDIVGFKINGFNYGADFSLYEGNPNKSHSFGIVVHAQSLRVMDLMQHVRIATSVKKEFIWDDLVISFKNITLN